MDLSKMTIDELEHKFFTILDYVQNGINDKKTVYKLHDISEELFRRLREVKKLAEFLGDAALAKQLEAKSIRITKRLK